MKLFGPTAVSLNTGFQSLLPPDWDRSIHKKLVVGDVFQVLAAGRSVNAGGGNITINLSFGGGLVDLTNGLVLPSSGWGSPWIIEALVAFQVTSGQNPQGGSAYTLQSVGRAQNGGNGKTFAAATSQDGNAFRPYTTDTALDLQMLSSAASGDQAILDVFKVTLLK